MAWHILNRWRQTVETSAVERFDKDWNWNEFEWINEIIIKNIKGKFNHIMYFTFYVSDIVPLFSEEIEFWKKNIEIFVYRMFIYVVYNFNIFFEPD